MAEGKPEAVDSELDNLLDSALNEFDAQKEKEKEVAAQRSEASAETATADKPEEGGAFGVDLNQMRESLQTFMKANPLLNAQTGGDESEFAKAMQETLGLFTKSLDRFQERGGEFNTEDFLSDVFKNLNVDGGAPFGDFLAPGLDDVLTKNLLYPGLKDIHDKFPTWLDENREKLPEDERERYEAQNALVKQIIGEYDNETNDDSKEVKGERQRRILELLGKMQALGDPPIELLGKQPGMDLPGFGGDGTDAVPPECAQQ